jgi:tetratricopeptide (TPR) repeat protein
MIDAEEARLGRRADETSPEVLIGLMWNLADLHRQQNDTAALAQAVDRMYRVETEEPDAIAIGILAWVVEEKLWGTVDELLEAHADRFAGSKKTLYAAATARLKQGKNDLAEQLAEQAARLDSPGPLGFFQMARDLEIDDRYHWAVREYRRAIDGQQPDAPEAVLARIALAALMHDHGDDKDAADVLAPFVQSVQENGNLSQQYERLRQYMEARYEFELAEAKTLAAQYHYYRACQFEAQKDFSAQRKELQVAIEADPTDADVLIAMYRLPDADENWRAETKKRIAELRDAFQRQIEANPGEASAYNQWAWLVSNTEGDFPQAIRYSHRSLELNTNGESSAASFLDTLGRCYYAAGDYQNAVKYQRQAVEKVPYLKVMRRQLELFETALAQHKGKVSGNTNPH